MPTPAVAILSPAEVEDLVVRGYVRGFGDAQKLYGSVLARLESLDVKDVLTTAQAAAVAGVKPKTIRRWIEDHGLPASQHKGTRGKRIRREDLDAFLTQARAHAAQAGVMV
jgi:excisionase family DNA binding protein